MGSTNNNALAKCPNSGLQMATGFWQLVRDQMEFLFILEYKFDLKQPKASC